MTNWGSNIRFSMTTTWIRWSYPSTFGYDQRQRHAESQRKKKLRSKDLHARLLSRCSQFTRIGHVPGGEVGLISYEARPSGCFQPVAPTVNVRDSRGAHTCNGWLDNATFNRWLYYNGFTTQYMDLLHNRRLHTAFKTTCGGIHLCLHLQRCRRPPRDLRC